MNPETKNQEQKPRTYKGRILFCLFIAFLVMAIGYIPLAYKAKFGTVDQSKFWDIETNVSTSGTIEGSASEKFKPYSIANTLYFYVILNSPGDSVTYDVEIHNKGRLDAVLDQMLIDIDNDQNTKNAIRYTVSGVEKGYVLRAGQKATVRIKVEWDPAVTNVTEGAYSTILANFQFVQL